jgi:hypothetical protein
VIASGDLMFYLARNPDLPAVEWKRFINGLSPTSLNRIVFDGHGGAKNRSELIRSHDSRKLLPALQKDDRWVHEKVVPKIPVFSPLGRQSWLYPLEIA